MRIIGWSPPGVAARDQATEDTVEPKRIRSDESGGLPDRRRGGEREQQLGDEVGGEADEPVGDGPVHELLPRDQDVASGEQECSDWNPRIGLRAVGRESGCHHDQFSARQTPEIFRWRDNSGFG